MFIGKVKISKLGKKGIKLQVKGMRKLVLRGVSLLVGMAERVFKLRPQNLLGAAHLQGQLSNLLRLR
jgi:hypothetical protein